MRSAVRIAVVVAGLALLAVVGLRVAITQPTLARNPFPPGARADAATLERHVRFLTGSVFPRNYRHPENLDRAADYIHDVLAGTGARVSEQDYLARGVPFRNVVGRLGPDDGPRIVVGAHYDVFGELPGADDNASGVAGLLETARLLALRNPSVTVELVAYSTEEPPHFGTAEMGSAVHAASLHRAGVDVLGMICLEMIGFYSERQPAPNRILRLLYPGTGDFILLAGRWTDRALLRHAKKSFRGASDLVACSYCGPTRIGTDLSDQRNYWTYGYPAIMITDTAFIRNPWYHTVKDTAETLDYERMAEVADGVVSAVIHLGDSV